MSSSSTSNSEATSCSSLTPLPEESQSRGERSQASPGGTLSKISPGGTSSNDKKLAEWQGRQQMFA